MRTPKILRYAAVNARVATHKHENAAREKCPAPNRTPHGVNRLSMTLYASPQFRPFGSIATKPAAAVGGAE